VTFSTNYFLWSIKKKARHQRIGKEKKERTNAATRILIGTIIIIVRREKRSEFNVNTDDENGWNT
jgi:membrane protein implicated in regulation of membrane protease activity